MALPEDRTIPADKFPDKIRRFVSPDAPPQMKQMLARGLVPMKPLVQVCALYQVAHTTDDALANEAVTALRRMPSATMVQIASRPLLPVVLDWIATLFKEVPDIVRAVLLNRTTDDDTFISVAKAADEVTCDLIARNQARLIQCPAVIEALYFNRNLRASTADRILDFAARNALELPSIPDYREIVAEIAGELPQTAEEQHCEILRLAEPMPSSPQQMRTPTMMMVALKRPTCGPKSKKPKRSRASPQPVAFVNSTSLRKFASR